MRTGRPNIIMNEAPPKGGSAEGARQLILLPLLYVRQAWLVILLGLVFGTALAGVETRLGPQIKANKENETKQQVPALVPGALLEKTRKITFKDRQGRDVAIYKAVAEDGTPRGWVIPAKGHGFADVIEVLVGLDPKAEKITGLFVLAQKETPALGSFITDGPKFLDQFRGMPTSRALEVNKKAQTLPHEIKPLSRATISSRSVCKIVNAAVARHKARLKRMAAGGAPTLK